ncbi:MAG: sulfotransferase family protein [Okeania sp. SIO3B5]|uniref:sulfotransferase family 2 domain-containing protein n=1 Tax=Okeania sp. SIO3B5 TaxID=2607811 RepID=UPI001400875F|nr:sulfotransferase family 2 domain-containing protein [Okeania sp. SIO3B5]NEO57650.1 sulfotransferase family protein [Okeania sp. SIO3B5]
MLSLAKNFLFIHVHKAGGNSIQSALLPYSEDYQENLPHTEKSQDFEVKNSQFPSLRKHSSLRDYQQLLSEETFQRLYKFACVRNPWERMMSFYFSPHRLGEKWSRDNFIKLMEIVPSAISMLITKDETGLKTVEMKPEVDFIIRFENLEKDFAHVCGEIGIPKINLPHKNQRTRKNYLDYYDDDLSQLIEKKFADDIEAFGYLNPLISS